MLQHSLANSPPTKQATIMATLTFPCEEKDGKLEVVVLSCKGLPDLDSAFNLTDAYVVVKIGAGNDKPQKTKAVEGSLDPKFNPKTSTFQFENGPEVAEHARIRFQVMDKDTFSPDDLIGKASIKLSKIQMGKPNTLELVSPRDGETHLSDRQTTAIEGGGMIDAKFLSKKLAADKSSKAAVLMGELDAFIKDKDDDGKVSFGEFLEQFRMHEDPGDAAEIEELSEEIADLWKVISFS